MVVLGIVEWCSILKPLAPNNQYLLQRVTGDLEVGFSKLNGEEQMS